MMDSGWMRPVSMSIIAATLSCIGCQYVVRSKQIERIVTELRAGGMAIRDEDLVHVWPLQRRHITPNGVYFANRTLPAFVLPEPLEA